MKVGRRYLAVAAKTLLLLMAVSYAPASQAGTLGEAAARLGVSFMPNSGVSWDWEKHDVDGQVGYPLTVQAPGANCPSGGWTANVDIASGTLPPGLTLSSHFAISGIPTARGHWIVVFRMKDLMCGGRHYTIEGAPDLLAQDQGWQNLGDVIFDKPRATARGLKF